MDIEELINRARGVPPLRLALPLLVVLTVANLLPALAPTSALLAFLAILIWFAAALAVFGTVTWLREDDWLTGGFVVGLTPVVARLIADLVTRNDLFLTASPSFGLLMRAVVAVPLSGGVVFGARWLTDVIRRA